LAVLSKYNAETDRRHVRRELTPDEAVYLLRFAEGYTTPQHSLTGPDRSMVYRLALGSGFRASELRSLTPESFDLDSDPPAVTVGAAYSKRRRQDLQPIRRDLADMLRPWLAAGVPVFGKLPGGTARMLRTDLDAARAKWIDDAKTDAECDARQRSDFLQYKNAAGEFLHFHATRHTYISGIVAGGASVKTCQELARHSSPTLTIGRYSHARLHDLTAALDALPDLMPQEPTTQTLQATGTDGIPRRWMLLHGSSWTAEHAKW
jgi:integrase